MPNPPYPSDGEHHRVDLQGKAALVTGGARRVGRAICSELASAGCDVAIHYNHSRDEAASLAQELQARGRHCLTVAGDLNDPAACNPIIATTMNAFGRLDILVNNASLFLTTHPDTLESFDPDSWLRMLRVNLVAPVGLCHHAAPFLAQSGAGNIVNLCDASIDRPWSGHLSYSASKAALAAMTKALARALAPKVRVNAVSPGIAIFPDSYPTELREKLIRRVPLQREGSPEQIARMVRFLCESAEYVTGQVINVDGGRSIV